MAHRFPNSLLIEATAAIQGEYNQLKTSIEAADAAEKTCVIFP